MHCIHRLYLPHVTSTLSNCVHSSACYFALFYSLQYTSFSLLFFLLLVASLVLSAQYVSFLFAYIASAAYRTVKQMLRELPLSSHNRLSYTQSMLVPCLMLHLVERFQDSPLLNPVEWFRDSQSSLGTPTCSQHPQPHQYQNTRTSLQFPVLSNKKMHHYHMMW